MISRMKYIDRWALMRNEQRENLTEHSFEVAVISHALAEIGNKRFGKSINAERAALLGLFHDAPETLTGDMPTPVKYYNDEVRNAYKTVEAEAAQSLVNMLPEDFRSTYAPLLIPNDADVALHRIVKAADKISALIKCLEEKKAGNGEFNSAYDGTLESIMAMDIPEARVFIDEFLPAYSMTLDELRN